MEGRATCREPIGQKHKGDHSDNNPGWEHLWSDASEIDFAFARPPGQEVGLLNGDGSMESKVRHLASHVHYRRSGDLNFATNMLAIKQPGALTDLAPFWLVASSKVHSAASYQQAQRESRARGEALVWKTKFLRRLLRPRPLRGRCPKGAAGEWTMGDR